MKIKDCFSKIWKLIKKLFSEHTLGCIANFCQILVVILAIFEYNKNIKPNFQNQLLSEENAKLTIENNQQENKLANIQNVIDAKQKELDIIKQESDKILFDLENTKNQLSILETEKYNAEERKRLQNIKNKKIESIENFILLVIENAGESRDSKFFNYTIDSLSKLSRDEKINDNFDMNIINLIINDYFKNPYISIYKSIDTIKSNNINNKEILAYIEIFKQFLLEKEHYLIYDQESINKLNKELVSYIEEKANLSIIEQVKKQSEIRDKISNLSKNLIDINDIISPIKNDMLDHYVNKI